ncbi:MAG: DUF4907 domain-containing protein [Bacteroides sp.]
MKTKLSYCLLLVCVVALACLFRTLFHRPSTKDGATYRCQVMEVPGGYGYVVTILPAGDTLIVQPHIPALGGYIPFDTQEEALKTGRLVCRKLSEGDNPSVSREEIQEIVGMKHPFKN